jgi:hypothetical protein
MVLNRFFFEITVQIDNEPPNQLHSVAGGQLDIRYPTRHTPGPFPLITCLELILQ